MDCQDHIEDAQNMIDQGRYADFAREFLVRDCALDILIDLLKKDRNTLSRCIQEINRVLSEVQWINAACYCALCRGRGSHPKSCRLLYLWILKVYLASSESVSGSNKFLEKMKQLLKDANDIFSGNFSEKIDINQSLSILTPPWMVFFEGKKRSFQDRELICIVQDIYSYYSGSCLSRDASVIVAFPLVGTADGQATEYGTRLCLERIPDSIAQVAYPHPKFLDDFVGYNQTAMKEIRKIWRQFEKLYSPNYAVRWRFIPHSDYKAGTPPWRNIIVAGSSLGAAFALGLWALHTNLPVDPNCYVTGSVDVSGDIRCLSEAKIGNVGDLDVKCRVVRHECEQTRILASSKPESIGNEFQSRLVVVKTIREAISHAAQKYIGKDGKEMILVQAGSKLIYVDKYVVTVGEFEKFLQETSGGWDRPAWASLSSDMPATGMTVQQAIEYAEYYGKRLPTPEEWVEIAVAGNPPGTKYPWGNEFSAQKCTTRQNAPKYKGEPRPVPVQESISKNPLGIYIYGNVKELTLFESNNQSVVKVCGISYWDSPEQENTERIFVNEFRGSGSREYLHSHVGFRCVLDAENIVGY